MSELQRKATEGAGWIFGLRIGDHLLSIVRNILLARLLAPNDFGLLSIAAVTLSGLEAFSRTGIEEALVQQEDPRPALDTAFTLQVIRGLVLAAIAVLAAPLVSRFFSEPTVVPILQVLGVTLVIDGLRNPGAVYFRRHLNFSKITRLELTSAGCATAVALVVAAVYRSVWALVVFRVVESAIYTFLTYRLHPYRPGLSLDSDHVARLFTFGKWLFLLGILHFATKQADDLLIAKIAGTTALGFYVMAFRFADLVTRVTTKVASSVAFPAFSSLESLDRMRRGLEKTVGSLALVSFPLAGLIVSAGPAFVDLALGEQWLPMITALQVLAVAQLVESLVLESHFMALGKPKLKFGIRAVRTAFMYLFIFPLTSRWGLAGAATAVLVGQVAGFLTWVRWTRRELDFSLGRIARMLGAPFSGAVLATVFTVALDVLTALPGFVDLAVLGLTFTVFYVAIEALLWRRYRLGQVGALVGALRQIRRSSRK